MFAIFIHEFDTWMTIPTKFDFVTNPPILPYINHVV